MNLRIALTCLSTLLFAATANAEGVPINPGQWEMTSTMKMTMMPQPQTTTITECVEETELSPDSFNMDEENPCDITDVKIDGDSASWSISCPFQGGSVMKGQWEFTSNGSSVKGSGSMAADFNGQKMAFDMTWEGKRIGACK